ncbi:MAG: DUF6320 domain-containing protein [bacterium]|nr:DUF6320 domain-containing protein [bacterium]
MSYCVHCGVELDQTATRCALCNTPVIDLSSVRDENAKPPFSTKKGQVERVKRTDLAILSSVVLASTAIACALLNLLVFKGSFWSFYIIGACLLLWVFSIPLFIYTRLPIYLSILFDGVAVALYLGIIAYEYSGLAWYTGLGIPITCMVTLLVLLFTFLHRFFQTSILSTAIYLFAEVAVFCVGLEMLLRNYFDGVIRITWASVVLVACAIIIIALLTIITRSRLREAVRRRMHL